jgi:hypothetical protein
MSTTITVRDALSSGGALGELTLEFLHERITVRELIRGRVYQEVTEFNARRARPAAAFPLTATERLLNAPRPAEGRKVDWEAQYGRAVEAFERGQVFILVDDRQVTDLEETIDLTPQTQVTFLRLVPLAGG